ncbi:hypothetical protein FRC19_005338 [Serendipita sp. 401]|nr:hypothetical protein FRC19_005338 [Serendipita sp. 401]KAG9048056.1 hypothetical protein FS842_000491 [Serendipita sp. 407]
MATAYARQSSLVSAVVAAVVESPLRPYPSSLRIQQGIRVSGMTSFIWNLASPSTPPLVWCLCRVKYVFLSSLYVYADLDRVARPKDQMRLTYEYKMDDRSLPLRQSNVCGEVKDDEDESVSRRSSQVQ